MSKLRLSGATSSFEEIKTADAAFYCGTAAEVIGLESIDDVLFTKNWDDTASKKIQSAYQKLVRTNS